VILRASVAGYGDAGVAEESEDPQEMKVGCVSPGRQLELAEEAVVLRIPEIASLATEVIP
jgi:hypothetical protein